LSLARGRDTGLSALRAIIFRTVREKAASLLGRGNWQLHLIERMPSFKKDNRRHRAEEGMEQRSLWSGDL
jgi:hypothetical protein